MSMGAILLTENMKVSRCDMQIMCGMTSKSELHHSIPAHATDGERCPFCQNAGGMALKSTTYEGFSRDAKKIQSDWDCKYCYKRSYKWYN